MACVLILSRNNGLKLHATYKPPYESPFWWGLSKLIGTTGVGPFCMLRGHEKTIGGQKITEQDSYITPVRICSKILISSNVTFGLRAIPPTLSPTGTTYTEWAEPKRRCSRVPHIPGSRLPGLGPTRTLNHQVPWATGLRFILQEDSHASFVQYYTFL